MLIRAIFISIVIALPLFTQGQQCGELHTHVFSIEIETGSAYRSFDEDQLYLIDAFGRPILHEAWNDPKPPFPRKQHAPIRFIKNTKKERKQHAHPDISRYHSLQVLGDYIAVFRLESQKKGLRAGLEATGRFRDSVYQLKIIASRTSGEVDTLLIPIDGDDLINFCSNRLGSSHPPLASNIRTLGGERKSVIKINLSALPMRPVNLTPDSFLYQFHFSKPFDSSEMGMHQNQFRLDAISIHDPVTFRKLQEIFPLQAMIFSPREFTHYVDTGHFELLGDRPPDLLLTNSTYRSEEKIREHHAELYRFNPMQRRYENIEDLSRFANQEWDEKAAQWLACERGEIEGKAVIWHRYYENGQWLYGEVERIVDPVELDAKVGCLMWDDPKRFHLLPVQSLEGKVSGYVQVADSFGFLNNCQQAFRWKLHDGHEKYITKLRLEGPIKARERGHVIYIDSVWQTIGQLNFINEYINIPLKETGYLNINLHYFVTDPSLRVSSNDGLVHYAQSSHHAYEVPYLITTKEGFPVTYGEIDPFTGHRIGSWKRWGADGQVLKDTVYSKKLRVQLTTFDALQVDLDIENTDVEIMIDSVWHPAEVRQIDGVFLLYPTAGVQAYRFSTGHANSTYKLAFESLREETSVVLTPFKAGTHHYTYEGIEYPLVFTNAYLIHFDHHHAPVYQNGGRADTFLSMLQKRFPSIGFYAYQFDHQAPAFMIDQTADSAAIMTALLSMPEIKGISQIVHMPSGPSYFDDQVFIMNSSFARALTNEDRASLSLYGFDPDHISEMPGNLFSIFYLGRLYNGEMLEKLNQLQGALGLRSAGLNFYMRVSLDHR